MVVDAEGVGGGAVPESKCSECERRFLTMREVGEEELSVLGVGRSIGRGKVASAAGEVRVGGRVGGEKVVG